MRLSQSPGKASVALLWAGMCLLLPGPGLRPVSAPCLTVQPRAGRAQVRAAPEKRLHAADRPNGWPHLTTCLHLLAGHTGPVGARLTQADGCRADWPWLHGKCCLAPGPVFPLCSINALCSSRVRWRWGGGRAQAMSSQALQLPHRPALTGAPLTAQPVLSSCFPTGLSPSWPALTCWDGRTVPVSP